jgi:hypothetical protein
MACKDFAYIQNLFILSEICHTELEKNRQLKNIIGKNKNKCKTKQHEARDFTCRLQLLKSKCPDCQRGLPAVTSVTCIPSSKGCHNMYK